MVGLGAARDEAKPGIGHVGSAGYEAPPGTVSDDIVILCHPIRLRIVFLGLAESWLFINQLDRRSPRYWFRRRSSSNDDHKVGMNNRRYTHDGARDCYQAVLVRL